MRDQEAPASSAPADAEAPAALPRTWAEAYPPRPKPEGADYGFLSARGEPVSGSRERLLYLARTRALPSLVWTPESPILVPPWEVPFLLEVLRENAAASARRNLAIARGVWYAIGAVCLLLPLFAPPSAVIIGLVIGALWGLVVRSISRRVRYLQSLGPDAFRRSADAMVEEQYQAAQPTPATHAIGLSILAVGMSQIVFRGASIDAGAVSRATVEAGDWWRLLTAPMLHGGIFHFWMNYGALEGLGRTMETRGVRAFVPLVFVAAALAGGVCSIALPPATMSVGASGGLMGMFGFLAVMAYRRRDQLPEGFLRALLMNIALIGMVGVLAWRFIDNAAHAGGLLAGMMIGLLAIPGGDAEWHETGSLRLAGRVAHGILYLSAALAIGLPLMRLLGWDF